MIEKLQYKFLFKVFFFKTLVFRKYKQYITIILVFVYIDYINILIVLERYVDDYY